MYKASLMNQVFKKPAKDRLLVYSVDDERIRVTNGHWLLTLRRSDIPSSHLAYHVNANGSGTSWNCGTENPEYCPDLSQVFDPEKADRMADRMADCVITDELRQTWSSVDQTKRKVTAYPESGAWSQYFSEEYMQMLLGIYGAFSMKMSEKGKPAYIIAGGAVVGVLMPIFGGDEK